MTYKRKGWSALHSTPHSITDLVQLWALISGATLIHRDHVTYPHQTFFLRLLKESQSDYGDLLTVLPHFLPGDKKISLENLKHCVVLLLECMRGACVPTGAWVT